MDKKTITVNIYSRWDNSVLYAAEIDSDVEEVWRLRAAVEDAVKNGAHLVGARLDRASLVGARLDEIQGDIYEVLSAAPDEVPVLLATLRAGKIDGSVYNDGAECVCLVGTLEKARGCGENGVVKRDCYRPAEMFFTALRPGHTPENHPIANIVERWVEEWLLSNPKNKEI